ncbi:M56 family metallopeptidase [Sphingomonas xinjiangensis]|uniref:Beta-lactamase regulating signal transducer with metallopeptidase domain n=1 Tax=Sphingomonas xinjiangensis TaxID=643568 RepID=A0A840YF33_9SPHN|nr:M56 family metallopeptidase [Sphingomonas xinjiangensis]MBB5710579.1 beta-lactamase regulating signal transducer with metallopeptidase domain [Sphingomonas xinjiangensis]
MIAWAVETFVATTLLMLLVLGLRGPVRRHFGPHMAYALWALPVARLVLPPLPGDWQLTRLFAPLMHRVEEARGVTVGIMNPETLPPELVSHVTRATIEVGSHHATLALVPPTMVEGGPSPLLLLLGLWALGALAFLAYHLVAHRRYCRHLLARARVDRTVAQGTVRVVETDAAHGPLAFGVFRKYVAFPRDFAERYDEQERDLALAHELGHHARGDLLANWVALVVLALHWFNPVAWRAFRAFRADQEMACDALVLAGRAQALRHAYGRAIVKSAHGGAVSAACHLHTINEVKGRLRMLAKTNEYSSRRIASGVAAMTLIGLGALGLTASGTAAATRITEEVTSMTGITLDQDMPAPPTPPAPPSAPEAPEAPEPPTPPLAPEPGAAPSHRDVYHHGSNKDGKRIEKVVVTQADGTRHVAVVPNIPPLHVNIPEIRDGKCGKAGPNGETVMHRQNGDKKVMIICTDRIEAMTENATRMAMHGKRMGLEAGRMGIESARRAIQADRNIGEADRANALKELDEAMAEIATELANDD